MRVTINVLMLTKWRMLSHLHAEFMPDIVGPFLKISLITHSRKLFVVLEKQLLMYTLTFVEIRRSTISVFFDLMVAQLQQKDNFLTLETEMIDKLDTLISGGMGDSTYRQLFYLM